MLAETHVVCACLYSSWQLHQRLGIVCSYCDFAFFSVSAPIGQGYGLTETCAGATFSEWDDPAVGRVGPPVPCNYVKVCSQLF